MNVFKTLLLLVALSLFLASHGRKVKAGLHEKPLGAGRPFLEGLHPKKLPGKDADGYFVHNFEHRDNFGRQTVFRYRAKPRQNAVFLLDHPEVVDVRCASAGSR